MIELRDYQSEVVAKTGEVIVSGKRRPLIVMPTGGGKTIVAADIIRSAVAQYKNVLVLAHRREIIGQTSDKLHRLGISHGIIQAGFSPRPLERVQVASISTLWTRASRSPAASWHAPPRRWVYTAR
jgi:DNA repair protein RadD